MAKTRRYKTVYQKKKRSLWIWRAVKIALFLVLFLALAGTTVFLLFAKDLPRPERFAEVSFVQPTRIYDRTGEILLYELFEEEKRELVNLSDVSLYLQQAVIAAEDANFYKHFGIDWRGITRAILVNVKLLAPVQGASTISQQLIRSALLTREKTIGRKVRELILTLELERRYKKDEILEFYLNQIPLGSNTYGVGAASRLYFAKAPSELFLQEAAVLAALIPAPSYYSPYGLHKEELLSKKDYVLERMAQEHYISEEQKQEAKEQEIIFQEPSSTLKAPHFVLYMLDTLLETYEEEFLRESGLKVITTLDWRLQEIAESAVDSFDERNTFFKAYNAALVAIDPQSGGILSMVGSKDWFGESYPANCTSGIDCLFDPKVNAATYQQGRQPGSAFKPFVYAMAFINGHDDTAIVIDEETNFGIWGDEEYIPENYDERFRGAVTLRQALAQSLNVPSVKVLLNLAGIQESLDLAKELGITTLKDASNYGPSLVLGGGEVRLLDIVSGYGVFAANGKKIPPTSILSVEDSKGRLIWQNKKSLIQILDPNIANLLTSILSDNKSRTPVFGASSQLFLKEYEDAAAKTGTTQEYRDAWTIGYSKEIAAGVWVGNNNNAVMRKAPGVVVAAPIWNMFMRGALPLLRP